MKMANKIIPPLSSKIIAIHTTVTMMGIWQNKQIKIFIVFDQNINQTKRGRRVNIFIHLAVDEEKLTFQVTSISDVRLFFVVRTNRVPHVYPPAEWP